MHLKCTPFSALTRYTERALCTVGDIYSEHCTCMGSAHVGALSVFTARDSIISCIYNA